MLNHIKKNWISILIGLGLLLIFVSPDAKSWALQQLMQTGLFNAKINSKPAEVKKETRIDFAFINQQGAVRHTSTLRGKVVFINFWASWCPPCRAEFPSIEKLYNKFNNNPDFFFLTLSEDNDLSVAAKYLKKENYTVPLYKASSNVPDLLYTGTLPTTIVLDKKGNIRYRHEGFANYSSDIFLRQIEDLIKE